MSDLSRALDEYSVSYAMREDLPTEGQIWGRDGQKSPKAEMLILKADTAIKKKKKKQLEVLRHSLSTVFLFGEHIVCVT